MKSEHLIVAEINESYFGIAVMLLISTYLFLRGKFWAKNGNTKSVAANNLGIVIFLLMAISVVFIDTLPHMRMIWNYKEVIGTTKGREWNGDEYQIKYTYEFNGKTYESASDTEYFFNNKFKKPKREGGMYIVVIDSLQPSNSLIDFNRELRLIKADNKR
ncbi:MAG: hypothetical protein RIC06_24260 [Cyclobacteriaceae bacterium]